MEDELAPLRMEEAKLLSIDQLIELTGGYGSFQKELLLLSGLCYGSAALVMMQPVFLLPLCKAAMNLSAVESGFISTVFFVGFFFGLYLFSWVGDFKGRRKLVLWSLSSMLFFSTAVFASPFVRHAAVVAHVYWCRYSRGNKWVFSS